MLHVFTTCALNFVPCAKLLAVSVKKYMPDAHFVLVLADEKPKDFNLEDEGFDEVLYLEDFVDQFENPRAWAFGHTIMELATALKPFTAAKLMERANCDAVMFFDPDCVLFGKMTAMRQALNEFSVVLTPHASLMHENSDWLFFERNPLKVGGFNLGFFGLQNNETGRAIASWWRYRLRDYCLIDPDQGLFTDQKWMDLLPNYTDDYKCMREPVYNIARWNTFQRKISKRISKKTGATTYLADGRAIQFVHFSGFYKIGPYVQGLYDRSSEPLIEDLSTLQELSLWYSGELTEARSQPEYTAPWEFGQYKNGELIEDYDRRRYKASTALQEQYPDPFSTDRLDSYWLHAVKQTRIERETQFKEQVPTFDLVVSSVQSHNSVLRKQVSAFQDQMVSTMSKIAETEAEIDSLNRIVAIMQEKSMNVSGERVQAIFQPLVENKQFNPEVYLNSYPDVVKSGVDPLAHFIKFGVYENRCVGDMDGISFLARHRDMFFEMLAAPKNARRPLSIVSRLKKQLFG